MKKRDYRQNCSLALASDFLGERWTLLVFRELLIQPCRFKQLNTWLNGMGTNLLAQRLKELEAASLIEKQPPAEKRSAYCLTDKGRSVESVILSLIRWGHVNLAPCEGYEHHDHWDLLAMKALFNPKRCKKSITVQFRSKTLNAWVKTARTGLTFAVGDTDKVDIELPMTVSQLQNANVKELTDNAPLLKDFVSCFDTTGISR